MREVIDSYMILIFTELVRIFNRDNVGSKSSNGRKNSNIIYMLQYIENNYDSCSLRSMAEDFGYNPNYLGSLLRDKTGKTFSELKLEHQMNQASMLITHSQMPIYEIAMNVGFSNLGFFYEKFRNLLSSAAKIQYKVNIIL